MIFPLFPLSGKYFPGTLSGLKIHISEILSLCATLFASQHWDRRAQAASTVDLVAKKFSSAETESDSTSVLTAEIIDGMIKQVFEAASGNRYWQGKETTISALNTLCASFSDAILANQDSMAHKVSDVS